ncbi:MAG: Smr/MutS family protein [Oscillospiraceae bacterium]
MTAGFPSPSGIIEVDVHGMTKRQAKLCIENKLQRAGSGVYRIRVIHGYHGGTELRDMVRREIAKNKKVLRIELGLNPGETDLVLRELY